MAVHLPGKVSRLIGDLRTILALVSLIEHDLEKRIVARHAWVKIDALLKLLPRLKNEYKQHYCTNDTQKVKALEGMVARLERDHRGSNIKIVRDALAGHALKLDLLVMDEAWRGMSATTFGVIGSDIDEIEREIASIAGRSHIHASTAQVDPAWAPIWRLPALLGDPEEIRFTLVYPAFGNVKVVSPIPTNNPLQDATFRAAGLVTFLNQVDKILCPIPTGSTVERILFEIMLIDYCAIWELLFEGGVINKYGDVDPPVVEYWFGLPDPINGAACLKALGQDPHPDFDRWREKVRNKIAAHIDPDILISQIDMANWPMSRVQLSEEVFRVMNRLTLCARQDIRTKVLFAPPAPIKGVQGLTGQEGKSWEDA